MAIDRVESNREEAAQADKKKADRKADRKDNDRNFQLRYLSKLKVKDHGEVKPKDTSKGSKEKEQGKENILSKIMAYHGENKEGGDKKEDSRKQEEKKQKVKEEAKSSSKTEEGHTRLEAKSVLGGQKQSGGEGEGGSGGGQGGGHPQGGGGGQGRGSGGSAGGGGTGSQTGSRDQKSFSQGRAENVRRVDPTAFSSFQESGQGSSKQAFTQKQLDEIVESVRIGMGKEGKEMELSLSGDYFAGLKIKGTQTPEGVVLLFTCPTVEVKKTFLMARPRIYARFKEKNIRVCRIDVI